MRDFPGLETWEAGGLGGAKNTGWKPMPISCARSYRTLRDGSFEDAFPGTSICLAPVNRSCPGLLLWRVPLCTGTQVLRAWLRSACPSGTKAIPPSSTSDYLGAYGFNRGNQPSLATRSEGAADSQARVVREVLAERSFHPTCAGASASLAELANQKPAMTC
jgi:hypothetical protein